MSRRLIRLDIPVFPDRRMFRVHEVTATRRALEMVSSIQGIRPPARTVRGLA